jgi:hypothetical protein
MEKGSWNHLSILWQRPSFVKIFHIIFLEGYLVVSWYLAAEGMECIAMAIRIFHCLIAEERGRKILLGNY